MMLIVLNSCADGAKLVREDDSGGVVIYPFKGDQGSLLSAFRKDALAIMKEKCADGTYTIVREGETRGRSRVVSSIQSQEEFELVEERRWGIQFQCK